MTSIPSVRCILAWNVERYTDATHSALKLIIEQSSPDIIFLSEVKLSTVNAQTRFSEFIGYNAIINAHTPSHYHGVAMLIRKDVDYTLFPIDLGVERRKDSAKCATACQGRIIGILVGNTVIIGAYTPNSGLGNDVVKFAYRVDTWDAAFIRMLESARKDHEVLWIGDANVAPDLSVDISQPRMQTWAGCRPRERANFASLMTLGWIDIWRTQHPGVKEYSWRGSADSRKYGMRLDHLIGTPGLLDRVDSSFICHTCPVSDHAPVGLHMQF